MSSPMPIQRDGRPMLPKGTRVMLRASDVEGMKHPAMVCLTEVAQMCDSGEHVAAYVLRTEATTRRVDEKSGRVTHEPTWFESVDPDDFYKL